jgi:hypothetical protein
MSFIALTVACESIRKRKVPTRPSRIGTDAFRNPRTFGRSGCTPAEPYPPKRAHNLNKRELAIKLQKTLNQPRSGRYTLIRPQAVHFDSTGDRMMK